MDLRSDTGVYVASGLFAVVVFLAAMGVLVSRTPLEITGSTVLPFTVGFLLFAVVYFVAMAVYHGIDDREGDV